MMRYIKRKETRQDPSLWVRVEKKSCESYEIKIETTTLKGRSRENLLTLIFL